MEPESVDLLRKVPIFAGVKEETLATMAARCRRRKFRGNHSLFHEGDPGHTLYVIVSGRVRIETTSASGQKVHLAFRGPGETVGEMSLIDGKPTMADAITAEPTDVLMLSRDDFTRTVQESPDVAFSVMACLADRLRQSAAQYESHRTRDVLGRVSASLLEIAERQGTDEEPGGGQRIRGKVSQAQIALQIGTTRESVNRAFGSLKDVGAMRTEGRQVILLDPERLRRYATR